MAETTRTHLVTGAGGGIGRAVARRLAADGDRVLLVGRSPDTLEATRAALPGPAAHAVLPVDVRDGAALSRALEEAGVGGAGLDGVVANAGVGGPNLAGDEDRWDEILGVNLTGAYRTVSAALPYMKGRDDDRYRSVLFVSSILARLGVPGYSAYCASKAGLLGLMRSLAVELARERILVNALAPGWVETDMAIQGLEGFAAAAGVDLAAARDAQMSQVPLRKMSTPDEVAELVAYLFSGRQTSFTGAVLDFNNGALMVP